MNVVEWLVHHGAKKIFVSTDYTCNQNNILRRLSLLHRYFKADITVTTLNIYTEENIFQLFSESYNIGPIDAVFLLPNKSLSSRNANVNNIENLVKILNNIAPRASLISYLPEAAGVCQMRSEAGYRTYNIQLLQNGDIRDGLNALNHIVNLDSGFTILHKKTNIQIITGKILSSK